MPLITIPLGDFSKGVNDTRNPSIPPTGALRSARNLMYTGVHELSVRPGTQPVLTFYDDAGTPAKVTSVVGLFAFQDGAIGIAHSTITQKAYLYRLPATMDGWYNNAGALQSTANPQPSVILWTGMAASPDVSVSEGLGIAYIANTAAADNLGLYWPTQQFSDGGTSSVTGYAGTALIFPANIAVSATVSVTKNGTPLVGGGTDYTRTGAVFTLVVAALTSDTFVATFNAGIDNLRVNGVQQNVGSDIAYFNGVVAFHEHLWGFGYGAGANPGSNSYRPELARYSLPNFAPFQQNDSLTIGDRVRTQRERIIAGGVVGNALILGGASLLSRVTGDGRDSWYREVVDRSYGFVGPKCFVTAGNVMYYWSEQGPMRIQDTGAPDPLWDAIPKAVSTVASSASIVAGFDLPRNHVIFWYDTGNGVRTFCAFDTRREVWMGPDADIGLTLKCAGIVTPLYKSTAVAPVGPSAPPVVVSTTSIGNTSATATWTIGDVLASTEISYRVQGTSVYTILPLLDAGITTYGFSGLAGGVAYEWRVRHVRNGQYSTYSGPVTASQFTTSAATLSPPSALNGSDGSPSLIAYLNWTNSGESGVSTEVWRKGPGDSAYFAVQTVASGVSSTSVYVPVYGSYLFEVRHVRANAIASTFSNIVTVVVTSFV